MFHLTDDFRACDDNRQPYSFRVERHTETENLHAWVRDGRFCLASIGNRHVLNAPAFRQGVFEMQFNFRKSIPISPCSSATIPPPAKGRACALPMAWTAI